MQERVIERKGAMSHERASYQVSATTHERLSIIQHDVRVSH
jgi:hypothetical protein